MSAAAPDFQNYAEANLTALRGVRDREVFVHGERRITAGEFHDLTHRAARALRALGIRRGQGITLLSGNLPETVAVRYAAALLGCRTNHLYNKLAADVQAAIVRDVESTVLVVDPRLSGRAAELLQAQPVDTVLTLGPAELGKDLLELAADYSPEPLAGEAAPDDIATIRHTGGTTGHPKGIYSTFRDVQSLYTTGLSDIFDEGEAARQLVCTTLAHAAGWRADTVLASAGTVVLMDDFDAGEVLAAIERERITDIFLLPPLLYELLDHPDCPGTDTSSLRQLMYGGCQASPARLADAVRRFGQVLMQGYGQNEVGGISVLRPEDHDLERPELLRTAGTIIPGTEVEIRDESGRRVPTGELGEIVVRTGHVMQGYWKQPELTAEVLRDGWIHTGDIGRLDEDGYLTVVDRIKDMIVVVGGHVYTTELEDLLNSHPGVRQSVVFGVRDEDNMERVHAVVVPDPEYRADGEGPVTADELREAVRAARGAMYVPAELGFTEQFPLTDVGKPDKKALRALATGTA
ncbi:AMP-binding protein [Streptomyces sp. HNM0574]|uniref:AMP-binding protein n=1 Tax=Streptomyces sp. HNM0574 TaxID=2714954 RepID=UPI00146C0B54|nr:AMP-binding protein [Streptomyces sp. HNM0574]NLU68626.1 AMP-binding protein [Streptomyces sp. HNM0574]